MSKKKLIVRVKGGLGNQLFCYAVARSIALRNDAELIIDNTTGFLRDYEYRRSYSLNYFNIKSRLATRNEMFFPFERFRRALLIFLNNCFAFFFSNYIYQKDVYFKPDLLTVKFKNTLYLDGCWQSENYFIEYEGIIRSDLEFNFQSFEFKNELLESIIDSESVALHYRWFNQPNEASTHNVRNDYYQNAILQIYAKLDKPHFFIFSDFPEFVLNNISLKESDYTIVSSDINDPISDFYLMSRCKHFIIANSTFSWWAAWLSRNDSKIVIAPNQYTIGLSSWGFDKLLPESWISI